MNSGAFTPQEAMDRLAEEMDITMARMQRADEQRQCLWRLWPSSERAEKDAEFWYRQAGGRQAEA